MLTDQQDAFGQAMRDYYHGRGGYEIIERDDGLFNISPGPALYFQEFEHWPSCEQQAMARVRGRVLDVGCGAGRHALYLQAAGFDVVGIDSSPGAVEVCRARGLRQAQVLPLTQVSRRLGTFDTILMLGNNFSLLGNPRRARWLLRRFRSMTSPVGQIAAGTRNPYLTAEPEHLAYHRRNLARGRLAGQARVRVHYKAFVTPWIEFLMLSPAEMTDLVEGTGWAVRERLDGPGGLYVAILGKIGA